MLSLNRELEMDIEGSRLSSTNRVAQPPASNKEAGPPIEYFDDKGATKLTNTDSPTTSTVVPPPQAFEIRNSPPVPTINGGEQDKKMQRKIQLLEQRYKARLVLKMTIIHIINLPGGII